MAQQNFYACGGDLLVEGLYVEPMRWGWPEDSPVLASYLWIVSRRNGKLVLVAQDINKVLPLTTTRAKEVSVIKPSKKLSILDYPEQRRRWLAAGWGTFFMDMTDGGILLCTNKKSTYGAVQVFLEDYQKMMTTPGGVEAFLDKQFHQRPEKGCRTQKPKVPPTVWLHCRHTPQPTGCAPVRWVKK